MKRDTENFTYKFVRSGTAGVSRNGGMCDTHVRPDSMPIPEIKSLNIPKPQNAAPFEKAPDITQQEIDSINDMLSFIDGENPEGARSHVLKAIGFEMRFAYTMPIIGTDAIPFGLFIKDESLFVTLGNSVVINASSPEKRILVYLLTVKSMEQ